MKNLPLYVFYFIIIGILSFQLWSKTTVDNRAFEQVEKVLEEDFRLLDGDTEHQMSAIGKTVHSYAKPENLAFWKAVQTVKDLAQGKKSFIDQKISTIKRGETVSLKEINDSLKDFSDKLISKIEDRKDREATNKEYNLSKFIKTNSLSGDIQKKLKLYLCTLKNLLIADEKIFYDYVNQKTASCNDEVVQISRLQIHPKQASLTEGETFEAEVYLVRYSIENNWNVAFSSDNEPLPIKGDFAHYSKKENTPGKKIVNAKATITYPLTGHKITRESKLEYLVLPKCSQNCQ